MAENAKKQVNLQEENVNRVIDLIEAEGASLGALVRNFMKVAESDAFANLMLDSICGVNNAKIVYNANEIKMRIISAYPYKNEEGTMLIKKDGIFVEMKEYTAKIIVKKAYYNAIGVTKKVDFTPATKEQIKEIAQKKEEKRKAVAQKKADAQNEIDMLRRFWEECMNAAPADLADIVQKYKSEEYQKDIKQKIDKSAGK